MVQSSDSKSAPLRGDSSESDSPISMRKDLTKILTQTQEPNSLRLREFVLITGFTLRQAFLPCPCSRSKTVHRGDSVIEWRSVFVVILMAFCYVCYEFAANAIMWAVQGFMLCVLTERESLRPNDIQGFRTEYYYCIFPGIFLLGLVILQSLLDAMKKFLAGFLGLRMRRALTMRLTLDYYRSTASTTGGGDGETNRRPSNFLTHLSTVDHRLVEDTRLFCNLLPDFLVSCCVLPVATGYYTYKLLQQWVPYVCLSLYVYWLLAGVLFAVYLSRKTVGPRLEQQRFEGELRHFHARQRIYKEEIALLRDFSESSTAESSHPAANERCSHVAPTRSAAASGRLTSFRSDSERAVSLLEVTLANQWKLICVQQGWLSLLSSVFAYVGTPICYIFVGVAFLRSAESRTETDATSRYRIVSAGVFGAMMLLNKFTEIVNLSSNFTDLCGYSARVCAMREAFDADAEKGVGVSSSTIAEENCHHDGKKNVEMVTINMTPQKCQTKDMSSPTTMAVSAGYSSQSSSSRFRKEHFDPNESVHALHTSGSLNILGSREHEMNAPSSEGGGSCRKTREIILSVRHLCAEVVSSGSSNALFDDVTFDVVLGRHLMVLGDSGCGKTTILRALVGLEDVAGASAESSDLLGGVDDKRNAGVRVTGKVARRADVKIFVLSQVPYIFKGTLAENVFYGIQDLDSDRIRSRFAEYTQKLKLHRCVFERHLSGRLVAPPAMSNVSNSVVTSLSGDGTDVLDRLLADHAAGVERDWAQVLSPGERQRVAVLRLVMHIWFRKWDGVTIGDAGGKQCVLVLIDEGTSHLDADCEQRVYELLTEIIEGSEGSGSIVSFGHRAAALRKFHHSTLSISC